MGMSILIIIGVYLGIGAAVIAVLVGLLLFDPASKKCAKEDGLKATLGILGLVWVGWAGLLVGGLHDLWLERRHEVKNHRAARARERQSF